MGSPSKFNPSLIAGKIGLTLNVASLNENFA